MQKRVDPPGTLETSAAAFGGLLKDIRDTAGLSQEKLARSIPCDRSQIARIEAGTRVPQKKFVQTLDEVLETGGILLRLWKQINWYPVVEHPDWFQRRARMDAEAVAVSEYGSLLIPGLLQTEEYIRSLLARSTSRADDLAERVEARRSRQHRFLDPDGPLLIVVLDESCIRNVVGSRSAMLGQCQHLLEAGRQPNIVIQVATFAASTLAPPNTPMSLITLPDGHRWVYSESLDRGHFSDDPAIFTWHSRRYDLLRAGALSVGESAALIREAMEGYGDDEHPRPQRSDMAQEQLQRRQRRQLRRGGPRLYGRRPRPRLQEP